MTMLGTNLGQLFAPHSMQQVCDLHTCYHLRLKRKSAFVAVDTFTRRVCLLITRNSAGVTLRATPNVSIDSGTNGGNTPFCIF